MTERPDRQELLLRFFPELKGQGSSADTEGAIALNVRACEAVLADLIDLYDTGRDALGPGLLALRLFKGARQSSYLSLRDLELDQIAAKRSGDEDGAAFFLSAIEAVTRHTPAKAALVALVDNSSARIIPIAREYPASSIQAMLEEAIA